MKNKISKATAALVVAIAAVFAAPAVASAYTPTAPIPSALVPGVPTPVAVPANTFIPGETVTFTLTGEGVGPDSLAFVAFAVSSTTEVKTATADGGAAVTVTLPEDATGSYALTAVSESGASFAFPAVGVAAAAGGNGGGTDDGGASGPALGNTGFDGDALLGLWVGGGVLVLAGASIAVATSVRRTRRA